MVGDLRSPPFSGREVGGGRLIPAGIAGDAMETAGRSSCDEVVGSFQSGKESWLQQKAGCMGESMDFQNEDLVDPVMIDGAQMEEDHFGRTEGMNQEKVAVPLSSEGPACMITGEGVNGSAVHSSFHVGDKASSGKTPVFSFHQEMVAKEGTESASGILRCPPSIRKPGFPNNSNSHVAGYDKERPLWNNGKKVDPPRKAWSKPVMVRLPAREMNSGDVVYDDRVQLDAEEVVATSKRFEAALVGRCFGRRLNFERLNMELHRRWDGFGGFKLVTISNDCFICFFETVEGREAVMLGGPWVIAGQVIGVDLWSPEFSPQSKAGFVTHVWVRFPALPMYCWGAKNIVRIAGMLGEPVYMDSATEKMDRGNYARVCIKIDLSLPLRAGMWVDGPHGSFFQAVEYEGLPRCCFRCGLVGHSTEWCPKQVVKPGKDDVILKESLTSDVQAGAESRAHDMEEADGKTDSREPAGVEVSAIGSGMNQATSMNNASSAQDGLGPWMLVSHRKKSFRMGEFNKRPGANKEFNSSTRRGQSNLQNKVNAVGSGGLRPGQEAFMKFDGPQGKSQANYHLGGVSGLGDVPSIHQPGSKFYQGQSSKGEFKVTDPGMEKDNGDGSAHNKPLFRMGESPDCGQGQTKTVWKRVVKRKAFNSNGGGDASPLGT